MVFLTMKEIEDAAADECSSSLAETPCWSSTRGSLPIDATAAKTNRLSHQCEPWTSMNSMSMCRSLLFTYQRLMHRAGISLLMRNALLIPVLRFQREMRHEEHPRTVLPVFQCDGKACHKVSNADHRLTLCLNSPEDLVENSALLCNAWWLPFTTVYGI